MERKAEQEKGRRGGPNPALPEIPEQLTESVIGCAMAVHGELGPGFMESVYAAALHIEFDQHGIPYRAEVPLELAYHGQRIGAGRIDLLVDDVLVVELKAVEALTSLHSAQVISYLKAMAMPVGLLINFNTTLLKQGGVRRVVHPHLHHRRRQLPVC